MSQSIQTGNTQAVINGVTGLSLPSSAQVVHYDTTNLFTTLTTRQIATPDASHDVYFLGYTLIPVAAGSPQLNIYDATAGAAPSQGGNATGTDAAGNLAWVAGAVIIGQQITMMMPVPIKVTSGIRASHGGAGAQATLQVYWMVVTK